jgi:hypothetical protein
VNIERALHYRDGVDRYATLHGFSDESLSLEDWSAIEIVTRWLRVFRDATTHMSSRDQTTISSVYGVFLTLQDHLRQQIQEASPSTPLELIDGLRDAHEKLAEYFEKSDLSPYYMWAACR